MQSYREYFTNKNYLIAFLGGVLLLAISLVVQYFAINYATHIASESVTDIVLSNTRVYDVDGIFVYGAVFMSIFLLFLGVMRPKYFPFGLKSIAIFTIIRSIFITLTHISPYPTHALITSVYFTKYFDNIFTGNDLFFSGHTGFPFLMALMFWDDKPLRIVFLTFSSVFALVVLLGHLHYSIDVLSAFFITYSIFNICKWLFKKDWQLFLQN